MAGITLSIEVDDKGTVKVKQFADESKKAFKEMTEGPKAAQGPLNSLKESWIGLTAKVAAAAATVYGVSRAIASFVNEAAEAEQIENRLRFALETTGYTWQYAKTAVDEFANSIQATTRFSDEQARQALTDLMMYTNDFARAQMGAKLAMDMSVRIGQDLGSTSRLIGMAMSGNVEMLGRYIPQLRNLDSVLGSNATMAEKAAYAMKILQEKFGGTAQADLNSYAGTVAQFKNAWSDLKEAIGNEFLPVLKVTFEWLTKVINLIKKSEESPEDLKKLLKNYQAWLQYGVEQGASSQFIADYKRRIAEIQARLGGPSIEEAKRRVATETKKDIFAESKGKEIDIVKEVQAAIEGITYAEEQRGILFMAQRELFEGGWSKEKDIVDQVREEIARLEAETNEWGEITVGRQELIEAGWAATAKAEEDAIHEGIENARLLHQAWLEEYTKVSDLESIWQNIAQNISNAWSSNMVNIIRSAGSMTDKIKSFFQSIGDIFLSTISKMITQWLIFGSITGKKEAGGGWASGGLWSGILGSITSLFHQEGGIFTQPTVGIIGEGGPEAVIPLKSGKIPIESSEPKVVNNINIWTNDVDSFRRYLMANKDLLEGVALGAYAESKRLNKIQTRG